MAYWLVGIGGFAGALLRYGIGLLWPAGAGDFPYATLGINWTGSFLLLIVLRLTASGGRNERVRLLLGTGFLGAYTTFSTFSNETVGLATAGRLPLAALYLGVTWAGGLLAAWLGDRAGKAIMAWRKGMQG